MAFIHRPSEGWDINYKPGVNQNVKLCYFWGIFSMKPNRMNFQTEKIIGYEDRQVRTSS